LLVIVVCLIQQQAFPQNKNDNFSADIPGGYGDVTVVFSNTSVNTFDYFIRNAFDQTVKYTDTQNFVCTFKCPEVYTVSLKIKPSASGTLYSEKK